MLQTIVMGFIASTLFIRPTMHRNNVGDASLYASVQFYALVHMLFDGCVPPGKTLLLNGCTSGDFHTFEGRVLSASVFPLCTLSRGLCMAPNATDEI